MKNSILYSRLIKRNLRISLLIIISLLTIFHSCKKEELITPVIFNEEQNHLIMQFTAICNDNCGVSNPLKLENFVHNKNAFPMAVHIKENYYYDPLSNLNLFNTFKLSKYQDTEAPSIYVGNDEKNSVTSLLKYKPEKALAASIGKVELSNSKTYMSGTEVDAILINLNITTKFSNSTEGNYFVNAYLIENNIDGGETAGIYNQAGADEYKHNFVLRKSFTEEMNFPNISCSLRRERKTFGAVVPKTHISNNELFENNFQITITPNYNIQNCHILIVVWEKENTGLYKFINVNRVGIY